MRRVLIKRNVKVFLLWYLGLVLVAGTVATATHVQAVSRERADYLAGLQLETEQLAGHFGQYFRAGVDGCNSIFLSRWYKHYRNIADVYADEFDGMRRIEIQEELRYKLASLPFITDILVVTPPPQNTVITSNGWFSMADYEKVYGAVDIAYENGTTSAPVVTVLDEGVCAITLLDSTPRQAQGIVLMLVDKRAFAGMLQQALPDHAAHVRAELGGQTLYESGTMDDGLVVNTASISTPAFSLSIASPRYEASLMRARTQQFVLVLLIILLAGALLSVLLTWIVMQPLRRLVDSFGGNYRKLADPYRFLEAYMEAFAANNARLHSEKQSMDQSMAQFLSLMRNEILFGMLTNPGLDFHNEHLQTCVPWINDGHPFFLALLKPALPDEARPMDARAFEPLGAGALSACMFPVFYNDLCVILWYESAQDARDARGQIAGRLKALAPDLYRMAISPVLDRPEQLSGQYQDLSAQLSGPPEASGELPLSIQIKLVNLLSTAKPEACEAYLSQTQAQADADAVLRFLLRIALEYGVDAQQYAGRYRQIAAQRSPLGRWDVLRAFAAMLCRSIQSVRDAGMNDTAEMIRQYIDAHHQDASLSMQRLSDAFGMHRTLISRVLKNHLGVTFSDYLLALRMQHAQTLMQDGEQNMTVIAEAVGYTNYTTFKRAFVRHHGVSPREYREKSRENSRERASGA